MISPLQYNCNTDNQATAEKIIVDAVIGLEITQILRHQKGRMQSKVSLQVLVLLRPMAVYNSLQSPDTTAEDAVH
eukprot:scaffold15109_cov102-Cylindrotheca_fusiformis.AAC.2